MDLFADVFSDENKGGNGRAQAGNVHCEEGVKEGEARIGECIVAIYQEGTNCRNKAMVSNDMA